LTGQNKNIPFMKKLLGCCMSLLLSAAVHSVYAQVEVAHLFAKGLSATGGGLFLHGGVPVSRAGEISIEAGLYYLTSNDSHLASAPCLVGYRHSIDGTGAGFYIEPLVGYTFGGTDIQKRDAAGNLLYNSSGGEVDQKITGPTAGMCIGYIIPSATIPLNFGLRYERAFVSGDPQTNMISFRISYSLSAGRKMRQ
jgi:hypothetical protein